MQSSGIRRIPNRIENTATSFNTYQASSITCGTPNPDDITVIGNLIFNGSVVSGLQAPQSSSQPVTLGYLQEQQQFAQSDVTVGMIQIWFKQDIPEGFLLCNGSQFDQLVYPELFLVLGTNILPDLRNRFIRGDQTGSNIVGQNVAQSQIPLANHAHLYEKTIQTPYFATERIWAPLDEFRQYATLFQSQTFYDQTLPVGTNGQEFYPAYTSVNYIIKAKSSRAIGNSIQNDSLASSSLTANVDRLISNTQLDMQQNKIINLPEPINDNDAATKAYVDQSISGGAQINKLQNGVEQLILQPNSLETSVDLNMQSNKIINVADATQNQDALNRQTADNRYYLNQTPLQDISLPTSQLNMNSQKISNMAVGTLYNDAVILLQLQQWIALTTTLNQVPATNTWTLPFQEITQTSTQFLTYNSLTNRMTLTQAGIFDVQILIRGTYTNFNQPITFRINSSGGGIIQKSVTQQQPTSNGTLTTTYTQFIVNASPGEFWVEIVSNPSVITLNAGCYLLAKKMY